MLEYIDREAALSIFEEKWESEKAMADAINEIPAADVAPVRHARWVLEYTTPYDDPRWKNRALKRCSACGWTNACRYNFCPNCGAKMDEEV